LGLQYEEMNFSVTDRRGGRRLRINGWWIENPATSDRCAILLHGYGDAAVGSIAWAPLLQSLGFNLLAIDLRAHGYSQGRFTTAGFYERHDLMQVIDQLKSARPGQTRKLALVGMSLGAAVAAATAVMRHDLAAVVMECPYVDFPRAALSQGLRLPLPGRFFQQSALRLTQILARIDYSQVRPVDLIPQIRCPLWVVQSCEDSFVCREDRALIAAAVAARPADSPPARLWQVEGAFHILAMPDQPQEYRRRLSEFLSQAMADYSLAHD
jgi:alpha-beta hydrolase superfamily lysophospholipase